MRGVVLILGFIYLHFSIERMDKIDAATPNRVAYLIFWALLLTWAMWLTPAAAQELSQDYQQGFCDGAKLAFDASMQNRDHNRRMSSRPFETHDQAIARIYSQQDKGWCKEGPTVVHDAECIMLDSIDLYVVLPPWRGGRVITPKGTIDCGGEPK